MPEPCQTSAQDVSAVDRSVAIAPAGDAAIGTALLRAGTAVIVADSRGYAGISLQLMTLAGAQYAPR